MTDGKFQKFLFLLRFNVLNYIFLKLINIY